jgi:hypothetical protein
MNVPCFIYNVTQFGGASRRTGKDALVAELVTRLCSGYMHYRVYDVRDCFNSVSSDALIPPNLPLQRRIYDNTLNLQKLCFRHDTIREQRQFADTSSYRDIMTAVGASGPEGLLQGSPASNVLLAYILQNIPQPNPQDGCILLFGDDLIVLSRSQEIVDQVDQNLLHFFGQPTLGPLQLLQRASGYQGHFEYLGYEFSYSPFRENWHVSLSSKNWGKLERLRDLETLMCNPKNQSMYSEAPISRKIWRSLSGHRSLTDPAAILHTIMAGGMDAVAHRRMASVD